MIAFRIIGFVLTMAIFAPVPSHAHKVTVFAWVEGATIHTESKFSGGKRVKGGKIEVFNPQNQKLIEGVTDDGGNFSFPRPEGIGELKVVLVAGMGHTNHWVIRGEELGATPAAPGGASEKAAGVNHEGLPGNLSLDAESIERIVDRSLERKLAPLRAQLAEQAWGLRDLVSGVGYILGLMGLASYLHYRKQR